MNEPCRTCPWRVSNHGIQKPDFLVVDDDVDPFSEQNARRLWDGIRDGEIMNCHRRDTNQGSRGNGKVPCAGAVGLVISETKRLETHQKAYWRGRGSRSIRMTREGMSTWFERFIFSATVPKAIECDETLSVPGTDVVCSLEVA